MTGTEAAGRRDLAPFPHPLFIVFQSWVLEGAYHFCCPTS